MATAGARLSSHYSLAGVSQERMTAQPLLSRASAASVRHSDSHRSDSRLTLLEPTTPWQRGEAPETYPQRCNGPRTLQRFNSSAPQLVPERRLEKESTCRRLPLCFRRRWSKSSSRDCAAEVRFDDASRRSSVWSQAARPYLPTNCATCPNEDQAQRLGNQVALFADSEAGEPAVASHTGAINRFPSTQTTCIPRRSSWPVNPSCSAFLTSIFFTRS